MSIRCKIDSVSTPCEFEIMEKLQLVLTPDNIHTAWKHLSRWMDEKQYENTSLKEYAHAVPLTMVFNLPERIYTERQIRKVLSTSFITSRLDLIIEELNTTKP